MSALALYRAVTGLLEPLAPAILNGRAKRGKEDPARLKERLGHASLARPAGTLVWLHGVSVGESVSLLPLIDRIRAERPDIHLLVTSGTVTSARLLAFWGIIFATACFSLTLFLASAAFARKVPAANALQVGGLAMGIQLDYRDMPANL